MPSIINPAVAKRFWSKVDQTNTCWLWTASVRHNGYGQFGREGEVLVHRIVYKTFVGDIPKGMHIDHLCSVRRCVNPEHLEVVTPRENTMRSKTAPAAVNARKTHCVNGHEFTPENTEIRARDGKSRACKACNRAKNIRLRAQKKEALNA